MFQTIDIFPRVGMEIKISEADRVSEKYTAKIEDLMKKRSALVVRGADFSVEELMNRTTLDRTTLEGEEALS